MANVQSLPKLRLRRPSLRGTLRVEWEWIPEEPYIGRIRFCFLKPPAVDVAVEPLSVVDVTSLPGIGHWIRHALRDNLIATACHPNWVETDMRLPSAAAPPAPADPNDPLQQPVATGSGGEGQLALTGLAAAAQRQAAVAARAAAALSQASK